MIELRDGGRKGDNKVIYDKKSEPLLRDSLSDLLIESDSLSPGSTCDGVLADKMRWSPFFSFGKRVFGVRNGLQHPGHVITQCSHCL